jgi:hypothetical protein
MAPESESCLYPFGGGACDPMAMGGIPPESQFSWLHLSLTPVLLKCWLVCPRFVVTAKLRAQGSKNIRGRHT